MKRKTLLALGIAAAFASGASSAATFLCTQDRPAGSSISCAEIPSDVLDSMTSAEDTWVPSPPFVTYYLLPLNRDEAALMEVQPSDPDVMAYFIEPTGSFATDTSLAGRASSATDLSSADQWEHSEPRTVTYLPSAESDAMNPGG
jgi:hypothetical protein